jgi:uncharacterized protein
MKHLLFRFGLGILTISTFLLIGWPSSFLAKDRATPSASRTCTNNRQKIVLSSTRSFCADFVSTPGQLAKGLSGTDQLPVDQAMLFDLGGEDYHGFWMKDMRYSIDIIWLDANKKVVDIKRSASPDSYPESFRPKSKARYVLETHINSAINIGESLAF